MFVLMSMSMFLVCLRVCVYQSLNSIGVSPLAIHPLLFPLLVISVCFSTYLPTYVCISTYLPTSISIHSNHTLPPRPSPPLPEGSSLPSPYNTTYT
ncbi:hypothetical protein F5X97DRAFT_298938 [Nemania serpens]|nr:hypothetical protein F5X97DRAFT_298938 [Nemania serpens]